MPLSLILSKMKQIHCTIDFHPSLRDLLHPKYRHLETINHRINYYGSVKDVIESLRVPHTEVGEIIINGQQAIFTHQVQDGDQISVVAHTPPVNPCATDFLRPEPFDDIRFIVDVNVAKLCSLLRMAGLDSFYIPEINDKTLAEIAAREQRIVLSRDRGLLKRKIITHGHLVRANLPEEQLQEIIGFYGLKERLRPFTRCMACNTPLQGVAKEDILDRLEPLTKKYYQTFYICRGCDKIYWSGSHKSGMSRLLTKVLIETDVTG